MLWAWTTRLTRIGKCGYPYFQLTEGSKPEEPAPSGAAGDYRSCDLAANLLAACRQGLLATGDHRPGPGGGVGRHLRRGVAEAVAALGVLAPPLMHGVAGREWRSDAGRTLGEGACGSWTERS